MLKKNTGADHLRPIRSFIRRERGLTPEKLARFKILWEKYGLNLENGLPNFNQIFGRKAKMILEIGFGHGEALTELAKSNPEQNYLGIEVYRPGIATTLEKLVEQKIENVRIFNGDAKIILENAIPDASLDFILIYFPDPWPKRRHHKRRLVQTSFVDLIKRKLKKHGHFHFATDWQDYAESIKKIMAQEHSFHSVTATPNTVRNIATRFEIRGRKANRKIYDLIYEFSGD